MYPSISRGIYRNHCLATKWRERLIVCLSPLNWMPTSLSRSGTDEGDRSSFYVSHSSSGSREQLSPSQTDSRLFRSTHNNWDRYALRESLLSHDDET